MTTLTSRSPTKRFSLASSASQSRRSVHFDNETLISRPEIIDSALKKRLSVASHPPYNSFPESRRDDHHESPRRRYSVVPSQASYPKIDPTKNDDSFRTRRRQSIVLSPTKQSTMAPSVKIDPTPTDDFPRSRRRHSVVLSPTKHSVLASFPKIDPHPDNNDDSSRRRKPSIVLPLTTTSVPNVHRISSKSPRKRRFSTISPPRNDPVHDFATPSSPWKRRSSVVASEDENQPDSPFPRTQKLCTIAPSTHKPPPHVCAEINQRIRSIFHYPDFDFIQHVQRRSYVVRTQHFKESECVTMVDTGVDDLLQRMFEKLPPQPDTSTNIDIRASPGRGLGMFSRKQFSTGEAFFVEYPTVITPYVIGLSIGLSALYADIFGKLSSPVFAELMELSSSSSVSGETQDIHEAIMRTNALAIELPVPNEEFSELNTHRAIFLQTSRCNHSCDPNARWEWDLKRFSLVLAAVRPIKDGEEITIPYVALNMTSEERQDILSKFYGFKCLCTFCTLPPDDIQPQNDPARVSDTKTNAEPTSPSLPSFEKWCLDPTFPDDILINAHKRALQTIEREDILSAAALQDDDHYHPAPDIGKHLDAIAMCYGALEDVENFRMWMERVSEVRSRVKPKQKLVFSKWLSKPTTFPVWGWRRVFCGEEEEGDEEDSDSGLSSCVSMGMFEGVGVMG